jgi:hypothetical protein
MGLRCGEEAVLGTAYRVGGGVSGDPCPAVCNAAARGSCRLMWGSGRRFGGHDRRQHVGPARPLAAVCQVLAPERLQLQQPLALQRQPAAAPLARAVQGHRVEAHAHRVHSPGGRGAVSGNRLIWRTPEPPPSTTSIAEHHWIRWESLVSPNYPLFLSRSGSVLVVRAPIHKCDRLRQTAAVQP